MVLSEEQYLSMCDACDAVLQAPDATDACIAIPWLHVISEHPVFLERYEELFAKDGGAWTDGLTPRAIARFLVDRARTILAAARTGAAGIRFHPAPASPLDVLFVSHLLNAGAAGDDDDFYFADWPVRLARQGYSTAVALINHTTRAAGTLTAWHDGAVPRTIFAPTLDLRGELRLAAHVVKESLRLRRRAAQERDPLARRVLARASVEALSPGTSAALRIGEQIRTIVAERSPRAIVVTHEGHAWERIVLAAARSVAPGVRGIAYQHALLFRLQHAVFRRMGGAYDADAVLTSGDAARERFAAAFASQGLSVTTAGSRRGELPARQRATKPAGTSCLVLPEGIASECNLLFAFSLECARLAPETTFVWRLHPIIGFDVLVAANPMLAVRPANVVLSDALLDDDIAGSDWALYRGSTAIVQAVAAGVRPIYLRVPGEMTIDPLYGAERGVYRVERPQEAATLLATRDVLHGDERSTDTGYLASFCRRLFAPADFSRLVEMLPAPRSAPFDGRAT